VVALFPNTDFIRDQLRLCEIDGDAANSDDDDQATQGDDSASSDDEDEVAESDDSASSADEDAAADGVTWDHLRKAVVAAIRKHRKQPVTLPAQLDIGFDANNDFSVIPERVVSAPSQCGVGAGLGAYALDQVTGNMVIATYSSSYYFLNLKPRDDDGMCEGSQRRLDDDERALNHSAYRLMFPAVTLAGTTWRLGMNADPRSRHTRAALHAHQTAADNATKAALRVTVSAGCGARVNHAEEDDANCECVFFTARGPSGKTYPLAGKSHIIHLLGVRAGTQADRGTEP